MATGLEKVSFHSNPKERQCNKCSSYHTVAVISHTSKLMLKILKARCQQYMNCEFPDVETGLRKGRETRGQIADIYWIIEKAREFQKNIYFCFIDHARAFDCGDHNKLWKILQDQLTCFLRNLYAGQEATVRTGHIRTDWFQTGKGCHPAYLTYMQCTSWGMPGWMKHELKSRLPGEISVTSDMQMIPP